MTGCIAMFGVLGHRYPRDPPAQQSATPPSRGLEAVTVDFLMQSRRSALAHFGAHGAWSADCHTVERTVPAQGGDSGCNGTIVAHVSGPIYDAWVAAAEGTLTQRKAHVEAQVQLVLQDLSDHDIHGYLALTQAQCEVYDQDLVQLVRQSLDRTTFTGLQRECAVHWEGTLVRSLQPPVLVLVVSIGF